MFDDAENAKTTTSFQKSYIFSRFSLKNEPILILGSQDSCMFFFIRSPKSATSLTCEADISELRRSWVMSVGSRSAYVSST